MDYKKNILTLVGFLQNYDTLDKIKKAKKSWQLYKTLKI